LPHFYFARLILLAGGFATFRTALLRTLLKFRDKLGEKIKVKPFPEGGTPS